MNEPSVEERSVEQRVFETVAGQFGVSKDQITRESSFVEGLHADSLDSMELVMELEEEFDINIDDGDSEKFLTVGVAIECVEKKIAEEELHATRRTAFLTRARLGHRPSQ